MGHKNKNYFTIFKTVMEIDMFTLQNFALQKTIKWTYCHYETGDNNNNPEIEDIDNLK